MMFDQLIINQQESPDVTLIEDDFDPGYWRSRDDSSPLAGGRGGSQMIVIGGQSCVLRQYLRGGLISRLLQDSYCWTGLSRSRPYREQLAIKVALLNELPVPRIVGYRIKRKGLRYRAAIISRYIENKGTLASFLYTSELSAQHWRELGELIRWLHRARIFHADLNANNILIGKDDGFYLIDFDKARIMSTAEGWGESNLNRLLRSLNKIQAQRQQQDLPFNFDSENWRELLDGYR